MKITLFFLLLAATTLEAQTAWKKKTTQSLLDDSTTVVLTLRASNTIKGSLRELRPTLVVRCKEGETKTYVVLGLSLNPEFGLRPYAVKIRLDTQDVFSERWSGSTDNHALSSPHPIRLAKQISWANKMLFEFTPFNANPQIAHFPVAGLYQHLGSLAIVCGWRYFETREADERARQEDERIRLKRIEKDLQKIFQKNLQKRLERQRRRDELIRQERIKVERLEKRVEKYRLWVESWDKLRKGMPKEKVLLILGQPSKVVEVVAKRENWFYEGRLSHFVIFGQDGRLEDWEKPHYSDVLIYKALISHD